MDILKAPMVMNFAIALGANKEFLESYIVHNSPGSKEML